MTYCFKTAGLATLFISGLLLSACSSEAEKQGSDPVSFTALTPWKPAKATRAEDWRLLPADAQFETADRAAADSDGLWLINAAGQVGAHLPGRFATLDVRASEAGLILATVDTSTDRPMLVTLQMDETGFGKPLYLPATSYKVESLCLYRDDLSNLFLFLLGEEGLGEQWLVAGNNRLLNQGKQVRQLSMPPESAFCAVDDTQHLLYVNEESVGIWAYAAHPEAELGRQPVDLIAPFGTLQTLVAGLATVPGGLLALDSSSSNLHLYRHHAGNWQALPPIALANLQEPERLTARQQTDGVELLLVNDGKEAFHATLLDWQPDSTESVKNLPTLLPTIQTDPVPSVGDAADDPAIWHHRGQPELSRVLGTDKRSGLAVYDLQGTQLQFLPVGQLNNVDIRRDFNFDGRTIDLAVASHRDHNSLQLFAINQDSGEVQDIGQIATPLTDIYGLCMAQSPTGVIYAIPNDKDGRFLQYRLTADNQQVKAELVREFATRTQPEGCVADDQRQRLFIGEEDVAVWTLGTAEDASTQLQKVVGIDGLVKDDIEGLAFYQDKEHPYLVISSQGNDSYVVLDGEPPYAVRGAFRIGLNAEKAIDGVSETDGLEVTSSDLGGLWNQGLLVVQDGRKRMPENNQNYKYVPWIAVAEALGLE
jgi:3-phytase